MTGRSNPPQKPPKSNEQPEVYSVRQDKDGTFRFTRRNFIYLSAAVGGTLVLRGVCPRFGAKAAPNEHVQAGMNQFSQVFVHTKPNIASSIADSLEPNDVVRLISNPTDLDWVEVATQSGKQGWVNRDFIDFSRAIKSDSPNFELNDAQTTPPAQKLPGHGFSAHLNSENKTPNKDTSSIKDEICGEIIQNGDFESGQVSWIEYTTGTIITDAYSDPYQGSWVAWFGGISAVERLTQLFHVPVNVQDAQTFEFYLKVTSEDPYIAVNDTFLLRFLDGVGNPITNDIAIANNTDRGDWAYIYVDLTGMSGVADQDMQVQFEAVLDATYITNFVVDAVSFNLDCDPIPPTPTATATTPIYYTYLPITIKSATPTPTSRPTSTSTPTETPCPSYNPCPTDCSSDCPFDCSSDCSYDCTYDCSNDCTFECIYDCTFDCIYDCAFD